MNYIFCNLGSSHLYSFPSDAGTWSAQFNGSGTRLLCFENYDSSRLTAYDLPTRNQVTVTGKVLLMDPEFSWK